MTGVCSFSAQPTKSCLNFYLKMAATYVCIVRLISACGAGSKNLGPRCTSNLGPLKQGGNTCYGLCTYLVFHSF